MRRVNIEKKILYWVISIFIIIAVGFCIGNYNKKELERKKLISNLEKIEEECNYVYTDIEESEKRYTKLLSTEKDKFKIGLYSSALSRAYMANNEYDKAIEYSNIAGNSYESIENGKYYSLEEKKYLAWGLLRMGLYGECYKVTTSIMEIIDEDTENLFDKADKLDTEALVNSIFLIIYTEYKIFDKANIYYEKLCNMEITEELELKRGEKIAFAKMEYAKLLDDSKLIKKYADECYKMSLKKDEENGTNLSSGLILNVAKANIKLKEYEGVLDTIKKTEEFCLEISDYIGMSEVYLTYAEYYEEIGEIELANEYYKKAATNEFNYNDDVNLRRTLEKYIIFLEKNNLEEGKEKDIIYEKYNYLVKSVGINEGLDKLLSEILSINDEMAENRMILMQKQTEQNRKKTRFSIAIISLLVLMTGIMTILISKKNITKKRLEEIGRRDYLTGVNTREYGEKMLLELANKNTKFSLAVIDIDDFKAINDTYGHMFGDTVLKAVAKTLRDELHKNDIVIRFGGEEFIVVFIEDDKIKAKDKLDKIRESVSNKIFYNNVRISFSGGIKEWDNTQINKVIQDADMLLYEAKSKGKNRVFI